MKFTPKKVLLAGIYLTFFVGCVPAALGVFDVTWWLDLALTAAAIMVASRAGFTPGRLWIQLLLLSYLGISAFYAILLSDTGPMDFMLAYKCVWYIILLLPFADLAYFDATGIKKLNNRLLMLFFAIYACKRIVLGEDRPTVIIENNFELIFLSLVFYASYLADGRLLGWNIVLYGAVILLSGSRSSAIVAVLVLAFCLKPTRLRARDLATIAGLIAGCAVAGAVFIARTHRGLEGIDRYRFFEEFLQATSDWGLAEFLLGSARVTPMPASVCADLSFYRHLFSYSGDGRCYSVILHAFDMRVIYDHGILVFGILLGCVWHILQRWPKKVRTCVVLVILSTGLSVSSLNNVYVAIGVLLVAALRPAGVPVTAAVEPRALSAI